MTTYGYARVSTVGQDLTTQIEKLKAAGCSIVRHEKATGSSRKDRVELQLLLDFIGKGDILMVTKIDRLARSVGDLQDIVKELRGKGADLKATDQPVETTSAAGKAFLNMLAVFAEFETELRRERQRDGIEKAKREGVYKGRPVTTDAEAVRAARKEGLGATAIAKKLGIGRATVYRLLGQQT